MEEATVTNYDESMSASHHPYRNDFVHVFINRYFPSNYMHYSYIVYNTPYTYNLIIMYTIFMKK